MAINIQQITDFLLQNKSLSIEKIGTISVGNTPVNNEGGTSASTTHFQFDKKATTTEELYQYIADLQQKNLHLVHSDVDSFFEESRQLMNIGSRPLHFQGVGYIFNDRNQGYKFSETSPLGFKESIPETVNEDLSLSNIPSYHKENYNRGNGLKIILIIIVLALLGGIGYFVYSLLTENKLNKKEAINQENIVQQDTVLQSTVSAVAPVAAVNNGEKKFIFETTPSLDRVNKRTTQLRSMGKTILVDTVDNNGQKQYKMYVSMPVNNLADTTKIKDSLFIFFGKRLVIE